VLRADAPVGGEVRLESSHPGASAQPSRAHAVHHFGDFFFTDSRGAEDQERLIAVQFFVQVFRTWQVISGSNLASK
jgi:hypothetical protein